MLAIDQHVEAPSSVWRASISLVEPRGIPVVVATPKAILASKLNHHAGFLLSLIDGVTDMLDGIWNGDQCRTCGRKDNCPVPLEEPQL